jgi:Na+-translocating ferredoxin:NAD+ oxidoreductase RnfD subunit
LGILLRSQYDRPFALLACLAMSSKYLIRMGPAGRKSHGLNPANFAAFVAWACLPGCWLSPGQWGSEGLLALWFIALGGLVTQHIQRRDVSMVFLSAWALLLGGRLLWLGYAWDPGAAIWLQQFSNGAVLLFAFFMISDPMTTPQHPCARMAYAVLVAVAAFAWQYLLYRPHGLIVMLFFASWTVPLCNLLWPKPRFEWATAGPAVQV